LNSVFNKLKSVIMRGGKKKNMLISVVILVEIILLLVVATYAWVETVSSIKITNAGNDGTVDTYVFTEAMIGEGKGTIDIGKYFKQSGDMHLAPASSADGRTLFFPKANLASGFTYRKGNVSDKNTAYLSVSFKVRADTNADFFFDQVPTFSALGDDIRVSVTSQSEGSTESPVTEIFSNSASTTAVVNSTSGATGATSVKPYADHIKGKSSTARLFAVGANETKIVTINVWLQKKTGANTDLTNVMSQAISISNLGITSSLTPRHVTLIPTPTWDTDSPTYYAWCWDAPNDNKACLYKLGLDENEHYSFDYNGTYKKTTFVRAVSGCTVEPGIYNENDWPFTSGSTANTNGYMNQTADTSIPNDPVDPTYIIETLNGGSNSKSTGSWHDPATIKLDYVTDQSSTWGTLSATTYIGTTTSTHVMEQTNSSSQKHTDTVHAWPGKKIKLVASAKTNYAFVGWYDNPEGIVDNDSGKHLLSSNATYEPNAPATATDITYYAKFKEVRTLNIVKYLDENSSSVACGTITINNSNTATATVDKGSEVTFSATAADGYTLQGIYTASSGGTLKYGPNDGNGDPVPSNYPEAASIEINNNTTYYARFTTNSYNVTANAYYSTNDGSSYSAGSTGGTVTAGSSAAGATSTASVKYKSSVTLVATPASGYEFVGWYSAATGGSQLNANTSYSYTLNSTGDKNVYARFIKLNTTTIYVAPRKNWGNDYYIRLYQGSGTNVIDSDNGFVKANYDSNTGYYKAIFSSTKLGTFYSILAKDTNHTGKVPLSGGYTGTLGNDYIFKHDQSGSELTAYSSQRCIWFIDGTTNHFIGNDKAKMRIDNGSNTYDMRSIGNYCYVYEYTSGTDFSNASGITFKRTDSNNNQWNYWNTTPTTGKSQYTATETGNDNGSWTN